MKTSNAGKQILKEFEGERLTVYRDSVGLPTVGVGHLVKKNESYKVGQKITQAESDRLLANDLIEAETAINSLVKVPLTQNQFDALACFIFNIGSPHFKTSTMLKQLNAGNYAAAAANFAKWNKAGGAAVKGLSIRREKEKTLFESAGEFIENNPGAAGGSLGLLLVAALAIFF